jgi:hypothetical protein
MRLAARAFLLFALLSPLCACSSATETTASEPGDRGLGDSGAPNDSGPADSATPDGTGPSVAHPSCPAAAPPQGAPCSASDLRCTWGDDARFGCRTEAQCTSAAWQVTQPACPSPEPACPATPPSPPDAGEPSCTGAQLGLTCVYDATAYTCAPCSGSLCHAQNLWQTKTLAPGCPATLPNLGEPCTAAGTACNYNACADDQPVSWVLGAAMSCEAGLWTAAARTVCM